MRLDQGQDHEELRVRQPNPLISRNVHGQSLDDAQAGFRAEWETKIWETRCQAEKAANTAICCGEMAEKIVTGGPAFGAYFGALIGVSRGFAGLGTGLIFGCILGFIAVIPPALLAAGGRWFYSRQAERLERKLRELELS